MENADNVLEELGSGALTHFHSITINLSSAAPKDPMANAMSEMMERIKSGNIQLKSVRTVSLIFSRPVSGSRLHAVKPVFSEMICHCFLVVCRSSIEIRFIENVNRLSRGKNKISCWQIYMINTFVLPL